MPALPNFLLCCAVSLAVISPFGLHIACEWLLRFPSTIRDLNFHHIYSKSKPAFTTHFILHLWKANLRTDQHFGWISLNFHVDFAEHVLTTKHWCTQMFNSCGHWGAIFQGFLIEKLESCLCCNGLAVNADAFC
jgi:hypothetical protein